MSDNTQMPIPDFVDVDPSAVAAAEASVQFSNWTRPENVALSAPVGKNNSRIARWNEEVTIMQATRSVSKKGLIDVILMLKPRTGEPNEKSGSGFFHFYINPTVLAGAGTEAENKSHGGMNQRSLGLLSQVVRLAGYMPASGGLKASLLSTLFPPKNQPGAKSPLDGKSMIVRVKYSETPKQVKNEETGVTETVTDQRLEADSFLPSKDASAAKAE